MTNINLQLRDISSKKPQRVWAVFFINKGRIKIFTNQYIIPKDWSKDKQKALTTHKDFEKINRLFHEQKEFISDYIDNLKLRKKRFYKDELENDFNHHFKIGEIKTKETGEVIDFISFLDKWITSRVELQQSSRNKYETTRKNILLAFNLCGDRQSKQWEKMSLRERKQNPNLLSPIKLLEFDEINYNFMDRFNKWLHNATFKTRKSGIEKFEHYSKNFIAKQISIAKQFCTAAVNAGYLNNLSYKGISAGWEDADNIHLNWDEINRLKTLKLAKGSTEAMVRDVFVFNCYLGLRFSDLSKLDESRFTTQNDQLYLKMRMQKTDDLINFPILPSAEEILKSYNYQLPIIIEKTYNEGIKELAFQANIVQIENKRETRGGVKRVLKLEKWEMVSSHTGRRSFATNFTEDGVPVNELMLVTGHTTEKSFRKYVKKKAGSTFSGFLKIGANR